MKYLICLNEKLANLNKFEVYMPQKTTSVMNYLISMIYKNVEINIQDKLVMWFRWSWVLCDNLLTKFPWETVSERVYKIGLHSRRSYD